MFKRHHLLKHWGLSHGFFAATGGFIVTDEDGSQHPVLLSGVENLDERGRISIDPNGYKPDLIPATTMMLTMIFILVSTLSVMEPVSRTGMMVRIEVLVVAQASLCVVTILIWSRKLTSFFNAEVPCVVNAC